MDCSPPGSSIHGILQGRILEWVAISFSRGSSQPRDRTQVSCIAGRRFNLWATREVQKFINLLLIPLYNTIPTRCQIFKGCFQTVFEKQNSTCFSRNSYIYFFKGKFEIVGNGSFFLFLKLVRSLKAKDIFSCDISLQIEGRRNRKTWSSPGPLTNLVFWTRKK